MRNKRGVWVVALLIGGSACTSGVSTSSTGPGAVSSTSSRPETPSTTAVQITTTEARPDLSDFVWSRVPFESSGDVARFMTGVAVLDGQLIAVGTEMSVGDPDAAVWTSADGVRWSRVPHDESVFGGEGWQSMRGVAAFGGGVVAVGEDGNDGAVWVSPDGVSWTRVHDDPTFRDTDISDVARFGGGVVAVGIDFSHTQGQPPGGGNVDPAVWVSADGYIWTRVASGAFESESSQWMRGVAGGDSVIVAVGVGHKVGEVDGAVWISSNGYTWTLVDDAFGGSGPQLVVDVTGSGSEFIAVGWSGANAAVWTSSDGVNWVKVPHDATVFGGTIQDELRIESVVALEGGVIAVGQVQNNSGIGDAAVWVSNDGVA